MKIYDEKGVVEGDRMTSLLISDLRNESRIGLRNESYKIVHKIHKILVRLRIHQ